MNASNKLSTSIFHSEWMTGDRKFKQAVGIFMENTKKPVQIIAFGFINVNLATFKSILNFTYSLYAVLKQVNNSN